MASRIMPLILHCFGPNGTIAEEEGGKNSRDAAAGDVGEAVIPAYAVSPIHSLPLASLRIRA